MATQQGGEGLPGGVSPELYALRIEQLGQYAYHMQVPIESEDGPMPPVIDDRPRWVDADIDIFDRFEDFDASVEILGDHDRGEAIRRVPKVAEVYDNLPFNSDERAWLIDVYRHNFYEQPGDYRFEDPFKPIVNRIQLGYLSATDYRFVTVGDRQGRDDVRDMIRRWAAWRRELQEYAGTGSYRKTMYALMDIGVELCPEGYDRSYHIDPLWWDNERSGEMGAGPMPPHTWEKPWETS